MNETITTANAEFYCRACLKERRHPGEVSTASSWYHLYRDQNLIKWVDDVAELEFLLQMGAEKYPKYLCEKCYTQIKIFNEFIRLVECSTDVLKNGNYHLHCRTCIIECRKPNNTSNDSWYYLDDLKKWTNDLFPLKLLMIIDKLSYPQYICHKCYTKLINFNEFLKLVNHATDELSRIFAVNTDINLENILPNANIEDDEEFLLPDYVQNIELKETNEVSPQTHAISAKTKVGKELGRKAKRTIHQAIPSEASNDTKDKECCISAKKRPCNNNTAVNFEQPPSDGEEFILDESSYIEKEKLKDTSQNNIGEDPQTPNQPANNNGNENVTCSVPKGSDHNLDGIDIEQFGCFKCGAGFSSRLSFVAHEREHMVVDGGSIPKSFFGQRQHKELENKIIILEDKVNVLTKQLEILQQTLDNQNFILEKHNIQLETIIDKSFNQNVILDIFPLRSSHDLARIEKYIQTNDVTDLIQRIKEKIGKSNVSQCIHMFLAKELLYDVNWEGRHNKIALKSINLFTKIIYDAVKNENYSILEYEQDMKKGVRAVKNRLSNRKSHDRLN